MAVTGDGEPTTGPREHGDRDDPDACAFAAELVAGVVRERDRLDAAIEAACENWRIGRLALVDRCVLTVAAYELIAHPETPVSVVIDEAVEVARRFGAEGSAAFVNGVLDHIARLVRPAHPEVDDRGGE